MCTASQYHPDASSSSLWLWQQGKKIICPFFVVFLMVMWLWTTGPCSLSCLLPAQSFFFNHSILKLERKLPGWAGQWRHLWSAEIEGNPTFSSWQQSTHHLLPHCDLWFTRFCLCNCWVIHCVKSILHLRKRFQNVDWTAVLSNGLLASHFTHKKKCFLCRWLSKIFSLTCNCSDTHSILTSQLPIVPYSSLSLTLILCIIDQAPFKRRFTSSGLGVYMCNWELCTWKQVPSESWRGPRTSWS